jgi:hypothetical protein
MTGGGGVDGGEKLGDGGLGGVVGEAVTFAWWWMMAMHACSGTRRREERGWRWSGIWGRSGIQGVLAVPYIPVQGSPGVFRES